MPTANAIITKSHRMLGTIESGDAPTAAELADALLDLNSIIDSWSLDPRYRFVEESAFMSLRASQVAYAIGSATVTISAITRSSTTATATTATRHGLETGNYVTVSGATQSDYNVTAQITVTSPTSFTYTVANSPVSPATGSPVFVSADYPYFRPTQIYGAFLRSGSTDTPLALITESYWDVISDKATASSPTKALYRPNFPFGQIIVNPPSSATPTLYFKAERTVEQFSDGTTSVSLPPGYQRLLELALALEIAPQFGARVSETVVEGVRVTFDSMVAANQRNLESSRLSPPPPQAAG